MFKATGVVRTVDRLGRLVIPIELRRTLGIEVKDPVEISVDGEKIVLEKYQAKCTFCGHTDDLLTFRGKAVCPECAENISRSQESAAM